ncbi:hypothetical protein WJ968_30290 [Achromobacter xylosoxidans]
MLQGLAVRHLDAARLQVAGDAQRRFMQFAQRDHVFVDDGGNAIDELLGLRGRRAFCAAAGLPPPLPADSAA